MPATQPNGWLTRTLFGAVLTLVVALACGTAAKAWSNSERIGRAEVRTDAVKESLCEVKDALKRIEDKFDRLLGAKGNLR